MLYNLSPQRHQNGVAVSRLGGQARWKAAAYTTQGLGTKDDEILSVVVDSLLGDSVGGEKREARRVLLESKGEGSSQGSGLASVQDKDR